jgi:formylmethanofuran dehydrogenase subunit C
MAHAVNETLEIQIANHNVARLDSVISQVVRSLPNDLSSGDALPPSIHFKGASGQDYLGAGLNDLTSILVSGNAGKFAFCGLDNCECTLEGDAGDYFGHSLASGLLICQGSVGCGAGAMARSGLVAVYGTAGDRTAVSMRGADVLIRGNAGMLAGLDMRQGTLIIGGFAGEGLGTGMRGGTIFLRGDAPNISSDIEEHRLREPDRLKLGLLLLKAGIKTTVGREFRVFRPRSESA